MDTWAKETWLNASLSECYEGSEDITSPPATALLAASGISASPATSSEPVHILDVGAGMGQVTESILSHMGRDTALVRITCGDVDDGLLEALSRKAHARGWKDIEVVKLDATHMDGIQNETYDYIFGNFVYFLVSDPMSALQESFRSLRRGGTLAFTTWSLSGPFALLQLAQAQLAQYPMVPPNQRLRGNWNHPLYVRQQLSKLGFTQITVEPFAFTQSASNAREMAKKMRHALMLHTLEWGEDRQDQGWKLAEMVETVLREIHGDGEVSMRSVVLVVTANRP